MAKVIKKSNLILSQIHTYTGTRLLSRQSTDNFLVHLCHLNKLGI